MMLALTAVVVSLAVAAPSEKPIPVILDTDIGDDIDDTWALAMILGSPQLDLKLITTAFADTATKTRLTAKILERLGRTDIPIGTGPATSQNAIHQETWLGDYTLDGYEGTVHEDGVQALIDAIHASEEPITLIVIGPQTNIAEALRRDPSIAEKARVVSMAGSVRVGYEGRSEPQPEWNVKADPEAAQAVFAAPWEITLAPLDICGTLRLAGEDYRRVADSEAPRAKVVIENYNQWTNRRHHPEDSSSVLFDTAAVYLAFADEWMNVETVKLKVTDDGSTVEAEDGRPVRSAMSWKDERAFKDLLIRSLTEENP